MKLCLLNSLTTIKSHYIFTHIFTALRSAGCHNNSYIVTVEQHIYVTVTSCLTINRLDFYVQSQKGGGWGDKNKSNRLLRESPCNDVMGYRPSPRVHHAKLHLKICQFNVSFTAGKTACLIKHVSRHFLPLEFGINSIVNKLYLLKHTLRSSSIP